MVILYYKKWLEYEFLKNPKLRTSKRKSLLKEIFDLISISIKLYFKRLRGK